MERDLVDELQPPVAHEVVQRKWHEAEVQGAEVENEANLLGLAFGAVGWGSIGGEVAQNQSAMLSLGAALARQLAKLEVEGWGRKCAGG